MSDGVRFQPFFLELTWDSFTLGNEGLRLKLVKKSLWCPVFGRLPIKTKYRNKLTDDFCLTGQN